MMTSAELEHEEALRLEISAWEKCCWNAGCHAPMVSSTSIVIPDEPVQSSLNLESQLSNFPEPTKEAENCNKTTLLHFPQTEEKICFAIGFIWIWDHLDELMVAGWTRKKLFGRGRYKWPYGNEWGAAWLSSWQNNWKIPCIGKSGELIFTFKTPSGDWAQQTAWPVEPG